MGRILYIDILKGWAILCIVFLHFENGVIPGWMNTWIGHFMISAFYFTSGWLAGIRPRKISVKELAKKRWQTLGKPYIYFSIFILAFDFFLMIWGYYDLKFIARETYKILTLRGIGTLWFLPSLFGGEIIFRYLLNKNNLFIILGVLTITLIYLHYYNIWLVKYRNISELNQIIDAPFCTIRNILISLPVIGLSYMIGKWSLPKLEKTKTTIVFILGIIITGLSIYINGGFCPFSFGIISPLIVPVIGPLGLLLIAYPIKKGIIVEFLSFWGINSLVMMVTHYSILLVICQILDFAIFHELFSGIRTLIWFAITVIAEYPIVWFFDNKAKWMLGKR